MDETRAVARLPHLDVEIAHRRGADDVEQVSIHLRASPAFGGFTDDLQAGTVLWPWLPLAPFLAWQQALQSFYAPWLSGHPALPERRPERSQQEHGPDDKVHPFPGPTEHRE